VKYGEGSENENRYERSKWRNGEGRDARRRGEKGKRLRVGTSIDSVT